MGAPDPDRLAHALARVLGPVTVDGLRRLSGGASRETWTVDARGAHDATRHELVLRRDPHGHAGSTSRATEYDVLRAAHAAGVAAPATVLLLEPEDGLGDGFVMARVAGETIPRKILRDERFAAARKHLTAQCGAQAARIHAVDVTTLGDAALPVLGAREQTAQYRGVLDALGEPHAAFELGLRWLDAHVPPDPGRPALVHGDFRNGNLVVGDDGLRAVLDWELAHLGDPVEDLGWLCVKSWRFGVNDRPVGGFGDYATLLDAYTSAGGHAVDVAALRFWETLGTLKWGVICAMQATLHTSGTVRSVELAALGRRVAEMEWDLLALLDEAERG